MRDEIEYSTEAISKQNVEELVWILLFIVKLEKREMTQRWTFSLKRKQNIKIWEILSLLFSREH